MKNIEIGGMERGTINALIRARRLALFLAIVIAVFWSTPKPATAYPTGSMSCSDIGDFAAAVVVGKENGQSMEDALEKVKKRTAGYPVERKNLTEIVRAIYTEPWAMNLSEEGARTAFTADCEAQEAGTAATPGGNGVSQPGGSTTPSNILGTGDVSLGGEGRLASETPDSAASPSTEFDASSPSALNTQPTSETVRIKFNEEVQFGGYSYMITNARTGRAIGRQKAPNGAIYLAIDYMVRDDTSTVPESVRMELLSDSFVLSDSQGNTFIADARLSALAARHDELRFARRIFAKSIAVFEVPEDVAKKNFKILISAKDRSRIAVLSLYPNKSSPTSASSKPKQMQGSRKHQTGSAGEPIYPSRRVSAAPAKRKAKAELDSYRRRLEQDWDREVARREEGEDKITPEQLYLWRRMERKPGTIYRNFIEDRARYGDPSLGQ